MIDMCWEEVNPDAVLDITNKDHMAYIPSGQVDEIVVDDAGVFPNEVIPYYLRMLKAGGKLVFRPGGGSGWPMMDTGQGNEITFTDASGRYACTGMSRWLEIRNSDAARRDFINLAMEKARTFYSGRRGLWSDVHFDFERNCFLLIK